MARQLFDINLSSIINIDSSIAVGAKLYFFEDDGVTPATTYTTSDGMVANANPMLAQSTGRFAEQAWLDGGEYIYILTAANGSPSSPLFSGTFISGNDLSGSGGSSEVGFIQAGAGAVTRTVQTKLREIEISVKDYGAVGNSLNNDTTAIQAAIAYAELLSATSPDRGAVVTFPPGQYLVTATLTVSSSRVSLRGVGSFHSQIIRNTDYGPTITFESQTAGTLNILERMEASGLTLYHDVSGGIAMTSPHIRCTAVTHGRFIDLDINNGAYGIYLFGGVDVSIKECDIIGTNSTGANNATAGITLADASESGYSVGSVVPLPTQILIENTEVFGPLNSGWNYGLLINAAEDVTSNNCYYGNAKIYNVYIEQKNNNKMILEVSFGAGTYIDGAGADSVHITGAAGNGSAYIGTISFDGCDIKGQGGQTPGNGIFVDGTARGGTYSQACRNLRITGCRIGDYDFNGVWIVGAVNVVMSANMIGGNNYNNTAGGRGVLLGAAVSRLSMDGGRIGGLPEGNGTSFQTAGIEIVSGATEVVIGGVDVSNNVTGIVDGTPANTTAARTNWVINCKGYNGARAPVSPAIPASTVSQYNPTGSPAFLSIFNGTVTDIKLNGTTIQGSTGAQFQVGPGDYVTMTYTVAPSWFWWPQ